MNQANSSRMGTVARWAAVAGLAALAALVVAAAPAARAQHAPASALGESPAGAAHAAISGDYLEARTADVFTGPCFANSEMNLVGKQAVMAWRVRQGSWEGVRLDGLSVVAAVRADATLGDPFGGPLDARALVVVDQRATAAQRDALVAFARSATGGLLGSIVGVESAPIDLRVGPPAVPVIPPMTHADAAAMSSEAAPSQLHAAHMAAGHMAMAGMPAGAAGLSGEAHLRAGAWVDLDTRAIGPQDHLCGNEEVYYPPLAGGTAHVTAIPAVTVAYDFRGPGLGMVWSSPGKRSAFVGHFQG